MRERSQDNFNDDREEKKLRIEEITTALRVVGSLPYPSDQFAIVTGIPRRLDAQNAPLLEEYINNFRENGNFKLLVDLKHVDFISSKGFWVLVDAKNKSRRYNRGDVLLVDPEENVTYALENYPLLRNKFTIVKTVK